MSDADEITQERTEEDTSVDEPGKFKVIMHNDDKTTFECVNLILQIVFYKTPDEAEAITMAIHTSDRGVVGVYTKEVAEEKASEAMSMARGFGFPLEVTFEPE
jgi:ATP-dependent Clp protease adaptor protein ClpS